MKRSVLVLFALLAFACAQSSYIRVSVDGGTNWFTPASTGFRYDVSATLTIAARCFTGSPAVEADCAGVTGWTSAGDSPTVTGLAAANPTTMTVTAPAVGPPVVPNNLNDRIVVSVQGVSVPAVTVIPSLTAQVGASPDNIGPATVDVTRTGGLGLPSGSAAVFTASCLFTGETTAETCPTYATTWTASGTGTFVPALTPETINPVAWYSTTLGSGNTLTASVTLPGQTTAAVTDASAAFAVTAAQGRDYTGQPANLKPRFMATLVENDVSENLQWTPGYKTSGAAPLWIR